MGWLMQDPDCYLSFGQEPMGSWVGIEVREGNKECECVVMSVRVSVMCCGSVQHNIVAVELTSC